ncbi:hypothetical protein V499_03616 [Pseudogymnoascus sp. VKM F-103]|uniref:Serum paraoxonase/arylesterase 2 n=1 Tax=Pseudogymnoascus verrucosus TaxID=342668 RepID=A0A1B8GNH4_9PEZI|nr:uncharacterized protein VE01_04362 [Pseudogymnoascus verrucosus]KFY76838.1 hypothetical protein V499_03616 [Pseudogymnoascus sp. VKM F-103]OBT97392.1 hypothetical protein VE01_04362 [Pseudogymnoascus verrucosus]
MAKGALLALSALLALCVATLWKPLLRRATVLGFLRSQEEFRNIHGDIAPLKISNTVHCEDLHYHAESGKLYTACEGVEHTRRHWFPPLGHTDRHDHDGQGMIVVVDPITLEATELALTGFTGHFVTHGIDIFPSEDGRTMTIFAVNHLPNPEYGESQNESVSLQKARSQIEVFSHTINSDTAVWIGSIRHARIRTPNDIFATSPTSFYVTNDHYYRDGRMRFVEDLLEYNTGAWSDVLHVDFATDTVDALTEVTVTNGLAKVHNPNGLGHTTRPDEVLLSDASGGDLLVMGRDLANNTSKALTLRSRIQLDSTIDNPSYYYDLYATAGNNASGYVLAGLPFAHTLGQAARTVDVPIPTMVWHVRENAIGNHDIMMIFQDDGKLLRSASTAVLVGINPASNGGKKQAWLFVTGYVSEAMVVARVNL